jgi:beta-phosphoglucomutase-like phosphatase (HAD superfamily)
MSRQNPYTKRAIERTIKAALSAGLKVIGVRPDGTVLTDGRDKSVAVAGTALTDLPKLRDAREKLGAH